ncbi:hypothetical protein IH982_02860 [Patescibacteria group bacterium]|nr:hypothetical protein [Patescibacteria group bacterium]
MAEAVSITSQELEHPQGEDVEQQQAESRASFLDPDVLLFALPFAVIIDILDVVLAIGVIVNLFIGLPLLAWMVWKTGRIEAGKEQVERVRQGPQMRERFRQRQQARLSARRAATRRALRRGLLYFLAGLIPIVSIFVLWTWAVISTIRGK